MTDDDFRLSKKLKNRPGTLRERKGASQSGGNVNLEIGLKTSLRATSGTTTTTAAKRWSS